MNQKIIMYDSPEAAKLVTVECWQASTGQLIPLNQHDAEHLARYIGSTHKKCDVCGELVAKNSWCRTCQRRKESERYDKAEKRPWPEVGGVFWGDEYFSSPEDIVTEAEMQIEADANLLEFLETQHIWVSEPVYLHQISEDTWCDDLPEESDGYDIPSEVQAALKKLNEVIAKQGPSCYTQSKYRLDVDWSEYVTEDIV